MIIDFHTHIFPDKIAKRTIEALSNAANVEAQTDGTLSGLLRNMEESGVDLSVIMPVNTRKGQFDSITKFAQNINDTYDNLISFGGIHPDDDEIAQKLRYLKDSGFKGVKIHPDYTDTFIDDERYIRIIAECKKLGLIVLTHAGKDPAFDIIHCPPDKGVKMLDAVDRLVPGNQRFIVFAHLGASRQAAEVEKYLAGRNFYIDISCCFSDIGNFNNATDDEIIRIIKKHGAENILFATDSPWNDQKAYIQKLRELSGLSDTEKDLILGKNAERLLAL